MVTLDPLVKLMTLLCQIWKIIYLKKIYIYKFEKQQICSKKNLKKDGFSSNSAFGSNADEDENNLNKKYVIKVILKVTLATLNKLIQKQLL